MPRISTERERAADRAEWAEAIQFTAGLAVPGFLFVISLFDKSSVWPWFGASLIPGVFLVARSLTNTRRIQLFLDEKIPDGHPSLPPLYRKWTRGFRRG